MGDFVRNDRKRMEDFINFVISRGIGEVLIERLDIKDLQDFTDVLH